MVEKLQIWWLSFANLHLPEGQQFLGVCIVPGDNMEEAVRNAWALGINPGGEVRGFPLIFEGKKYIDNKWMMRLLSNSDCDELSAEVLAKRLASGGPN